MDNILEKLFGSAARVKILRLFLQNLDRSFTLPQIIQRTQVNSRSARPELQRIIKIGLIRKKTAIIQERIERKTRPKSKRAKITIKKRKMVVFTVNPSFEVLPELKDLITKSSPASNQQMLKKIKKIKGVKLVIISGIFLKQPNSRTDILIVGDDIPRRRIESILGRTESEIGKTVQYTLMETDEFKYRLGMYDRFLRDILEYPHEKLINRLGI